MSNQDKFMLSDSSDSQAADDSFPDFTEKPSAYFQGDATMSLSHKKKRLKGTRERSRVPNFSAQKEYTTLSNYSPRDQHIFLDVVSKALQGDTWEFLDLETSQESIKEVFYYLALLKRFRQLSMQGVEMTVSDEGFHVGESTFETLDDVEKAIKNKAFL